MANRTDTQADTVHGANPQYLVDRIIRVKIYNDAYWKEHCFGLTTELIIDKVADIDYLGGTFGGRRRPCKFLCLFLKLLQIQPDEDVVMEYIKQPDFKYLRALGAAYLRISARSVKIYETLEPLYADYRKLRYRDLTGKLSLIHMDEFIDWLLHEETVCDVTMPQLPKREILEDTDKLKPYQSVLEDDLDDLEELEQAIATASNDGVTAAVSVEDARMAATANTAPGGIDAPEAPVAGPAAELAPQPGPSPKPQRSRSRSRSRRRRRSRSASSRRMKSSSSEGSSRLRSRQDKKDRRDKRARDREKDKERHQKEREKDRDRQRDKDKERERRERRADKRDDRRDVRMEDKTRRPSREIQRSERHERRDGQDTKADTGTNVDKVLKVDAELVACATADTTANKDRKDKKDKHDKKDKPVSDVPIIPEPPVVTEVDMKGSNAAAKEKKKKKEKPKGLWKKQVPGETSAGIGAPKVEKKAKSDKDGLSVDDWNEIRKDMGLKPLKE